MPFLISTSYHVRSFVFPPFTFHGTIADQQNDNVPFGESLGDTKAGRCSTGCTLYIFRSAPQMNNNKVCTLYVHGVITTLSLST